jgi:hypothetical protein
MLMSDRPGFSKTSFKIKMYGLTTSNETNFRKALTPDFVQLMYVRILYKCSLYKPLQSFISEKGGSLGSATCVPSSLPIPL